MRAINHALTGAVIGLAVPVPALALPAALLSHYVCDAIPHHGPAKPSAKHLKSKRFAQVLFIDALACVLLVLLLAVNRPANWVLAGVCAFIATLPDVAWLPKWLNARHRRPAPAALHWHNRFAARIQWFERPIGGVVEVVWFAAFVSVLITYL
ncbi:MAG TPA: hypothetical protein VGE30_02920 [Candidatus Saccharimonadales bacterium]